MRLNSAIIGGLLALAVLAAGILSESRDISILLVLPGLIAVGLCAYLTVRSPQIFLVAAVFASQWKEYWPFSSLDRVADLTLVMLGCIIVAIAWRLMKQV